MTILAVDVDYREDVAQAAGVLFQAWSDEKPSQEITVQVSGIHEYVPGQFYRRELPCILALWAKLSPKPAIVVIDGYVYLGEGQQPGLGQHLYEALEKQVAVIGVAKSGYKGVAEACAVVRGKSERPLFVTAVGLDETLAREHIRGMAGSYRLPTLLKRVDQLCRQREQPPF